MHTRVTTLDVPSGKMEELVRLYEESLLPTAETQQGFRGALLLRDVEADRAMILTFWATEEDMRQGEGSGYYRDKLGRIAAILGEGSMTTRFDAGNQAGPSP